MSKSFSTIAVIISAFVLAYIALISYGPILPYLLPKGLLCTVNSLADQFLVTVVFAASVGLIPVSCMVTWNIIKAETVTKRLLSVLTILGCATLAVIIRYNMLPSPTAADNVATGGLPFSVDVSDLHYGESVILGLLTGIIISILFLRNKNSVKSIS